MFATLMLLRRQVDLRAHSDELLRGIDISLKRHGIRGFVRLRIRKAWLFFAFQGFGRQCPFCHVTLRRFIAYSVKPRVVSHRSALPVAVVSMIRSVFSASPTNENGMSTFS
jgi:hypothetical protein